MLLLPISEKLNDHQIKTRAQHVFQLAASQLINFLSDHIIGCLWNMHIWINTFFVTLTPLSTYLIKGFLADAAIIFGEINLLSAAVSIGGSFKQTIMLRVRFRPENRQRNAIFHATKAELLTNRSLRKTKNANACGCQVACYPIMFIYSVGR